MARRLEILGVNVDALTKSDVLSQIEHALNIKQKLFIVTMNPEGIMKAADDNDFRKKVNTADIVTADGIGVMWAGSFLFKKSFLSFIRFVTIPVRAFFSLIGILLWPSVIKKIFPERISGSDLFWDILKICEQKKKKVYLLGGSEGIARKVKEKIEKKKIKTEIVGTYAGAPNEKGLIDKINKKEPDVLYVAWGQPKQEKFLVETFNKLESIINIGVGGTFDFVSGKRIRAPKLMQIAGLEWFWRLLLEPKRIGRIFVAVPKFVYAVVKHKIRNPYGSKN